MRITAKTFTLTLVLLFSAMLWCGSVSAQRREYSAQQKEFVLEMENDLVFDFVERKFPHYSPEQVYELVKALPDFIRTKHAIEQLDWARTQPAKVYWDGLDKKIPSQGNDLVDKFLSKKWASYGVKTFDQGREGQELKTAIRLFRFGKDGLDNERVIACNISAGGAKTVKEVEKALDKFSVYPKSLFTYALTEIQVRKLGEKVTFDWKGKSFVFEPNTLYIYYKMESTSEQKGTRIAPEPIPSQAYTLFPVAESGCWIGLLQGLDEKGKVGAEATVLFEPLPEQTAIQPRGDIKFEPVSSTNPGQRSVAAATLTTQPLLSQTRPIGQSNDDELARLKANVALQQAKADKVNGEIAVRKAASIGGAFTPSSGSIGGTAVPQGQGECRQCSCRVFVADPKDYNNCTCQCGHSYYFH